MNIQVNEDQFLDPLWRIHNLYTIIDKSGKVIPFRPNWAQQYLLENFHNRNLILKARQLGFTTLMAIVQTDACVFMPNIRAAIIAHRMDDAKTIFRDKVKFTYDNLDDGIKNMVPPRQDSADTLTLGNNSSFKVSTSTRSGTLQYLHISEYGKICAQFPEKAREIRTGAIPSAEQGVTTIESTAEGQDGDFFKKASDAESLTRQGIEPSRLNFKFFFFPWYLEPNYSIRQVVTPISPEDHKYFDKIEREIQDYTDIEDFHLKEEQKLWWVNEESNLGGDMKREYPATPREAFEQAIEGAYFADQIASAEKHGRIGDFPIDPALPVNTFWDLGINDFNVIWLEQDQGEWMTFIGYYENNDEWIGHYVQWLKDWSLDNQVTYGKHYLPHDGDVKSLWIPGGSMDVMNKLGFKPIVVKNPGPNMKIEVIRSTRRRFSMYRFDRSNCKQGIKHLKQYRRKFNETTMQFSDTPLHNSAAHGADGLMTATVANYRPRESTRDEKYDRYKRARTRNREGTTFMSA